MVVDRAACRPHHRLNRIAEAPVTADPGFVHLHVHSAYSLLEGALVISRLAEFAKADHQPALALTDTDNMFGALEFSEKLAGYGIQPIVGCALALDFADEPRDPRLAARPGGRAPEGPLLELTYARDIPLVATNEPYFAKREDYDAHDALIAIAEGRVVADTDRRQLTAEHYFKSRAEMAALFADLPEALASTVEIAQRCAFRPRTEKPILPRFSVGDRAVDEGAELRTRAEAGLERRVAAYGLAPGRTIEEYRQRHAFELQVIEGMKYPGYFLIVSDFIQWAKDQGIPVGPGRGSGAGSLVSYALTITDLDPPRFNLLFERFLNPERLSMPDFDIDFCQDRRDEVIRYVQERYGRDQVAQIITFGTLQARGVLRDVGRVLEMPYGQVDKICKLVPQNPAAPVTLAKESDSEPQLQAERDRDPTVK